MRKIFVAISSALLFLLIFYPQTAVALPSSAVSCTLRAELIAFEQSRITIADAQGNTYQLLAQDCQVNGKWELEAGSTAVIHCAAHAGSVYALSLRIAAPPPDAIRAISIMDKMTLRQKIAQMLFVRCPVEDETTMLAQLQPGGVILFGVNVASETVESLKNKLQAMQQTAKIPLCIGIDEEGGGVCRISSYAQYRASRFPSPQGLYATGGWEAIAADTREKAALLLSLGINVNFAPVADVSTNAADFIYNRTLGQDAGQTAKYVQVVIEQMEALGIGSVLKHFPGYGNNADTHQAIVVDKRSKEHFFNSDFLPFSAGIAEGADFVLINHNIVSAFDENYPASLSPTIHQLLRNELGFRGLIITDDLAMGGISYFCDSKEAAILAVLAGNDMLLTSDAEVQLEAIADAVESGRIAEEQIDKAVLRILRYKITSDLL